MSTLCWNCRGLGNAATVRELRQLVRRVAPSILCVIETQLHKRRVEALAPSLGFDKGFAVSSAGRSGGLGIFWNHNTKMEILPFSQHYIDAIVTKADSNPWRLTCVYGEAQTTERHKTWDVLKFIKSSTALPWLFIGDFNEMLHRQEHVGVLERSNAQMAGFREMVDVCELIDLGFSGTNWTYEKKVAGDTYCRVRLDRALVMAD